MKYRVTALPGLNKYIIEKRLFPMVWFPVDKTIYTSYDEAKEAMEKLD